MANALSRAALKRAVMLSADVELQLTQRDKTAPVVALLGKARRAAAAALVAMADVDASDANAVRELQIELRCFDRIVQWLHEIVAEGFECGELLDGINDAAAEILVSEDDEDYASELPQTED